MPTRFANRYPSMLTSVITPSPLGTATVIGAALSRFTVAVNSPERSGKAAAQAGCAAQPSNSSWYVAAKPGQEPSMGFRLGGLTESSTTLRIPSGWSRSTRSARSVP